MTDWMNAFSGEGICGLAKSSWSFAAGAPSKVKK
jgi:hypothetical protein